MVAGKGAVLLSGKSMEDNGEYIQSRRVMKEDGREGENRI